MAKMKYPRDEKGRVILGTQHGIVITRPWSNEMYEHNDRIKENMVSNISKALVNAFGKSDFELVKTISKAVNTYGYGHGMSLTEIYEDGVRGLERISNHELHEWAYPDLVKKGIVEELPVMMVGYDKL